MTASERLLVNTIAQYGRTLINTFITLYTIRLVLLYLGASDFGVYTLVAGFVAMISFVTNSLITTTQRFVSYYQNDYYSTELKLIFVNCLFVHIVFGFVVVLILECISPFIFNGLLNIPLQRIEAAKYVYQLVIALIFITFLFSPYKALLVAHENIVYISIVEIIEAVLRLILVLCMTFINSDKLVFYAFSVFIVQFLAFLAFYIYSKIKYCECKKISLLNVSKEYLKKILSFTGWTVYSAGCYVAQKEGIAIVVNRFFGTVANAGYGIGFQVASYTNVLASAITNAIKPQITKAEGGNDRNKALWLSWVNSKVVFFLTSVVCIPAMFEISTILNVWLKNVPEYSVPFCIMAMASLMVDSLTTGLTTMNAATGHISKYTIYFATPKLLTLPLSYVLFKLGFSVEVVVICYIIVELIVAICRIPYMAKNTGFTVRQFVKDVLAREIIPVFFCIVSCYLVVTIFDNKYRIFLSFLVSVVVLMIFIWLIGLTNREKHALLNVFHTIRNKHEKK